MTPSLMSVAPMAVELPVKPALLTLDDVTLRYVTREHRVTATYRVGFEIDAGDRFVILGASGCGKSTLLKAIGGSCARYPAASR